ncbi:MAG: DUF6359 domain-containing protein [Bacteroidales bacterium]
MKHIYSLKSFLLTALLSGFGGSYLLAQAGSENQPLTVSEGLIKNDSSNQQYWVSGYVVGEFHNYSNNKFFYDMAPPFQGSITYLIADTAEEIDIKKCMTLQYPASGNIDEYALDVNSQYWKKKITVCGLLRSYNNRPGVKSISTFYFDQFSTDQNEAMNWNFFESMDEKTYTPSSSSSTYTGGIYTGETGKWKLKGGTHGTSGDDTKWDYGAARLRKTEGTSGENGFLELISDKENGLGEIRFWAGNYEGDKAMSLSFSVHYSLNAGTDWIPVKLNESVKRGNNVTTAGMSEYRYFINQPGRGRIRISKADGSSGSINIDNIRISDFQVINGIENSQQEKPIVTGTDGGILLGEGATQGIYVYNISGQLIHSIKSDISNKFIPLPKGIYLIRIREKATRVVVR